MSGIAVFGTGLVLTFHITQIMAGGDHDLGGVIALGAVLISFPAVLGAGLFLGVAMSDGVTGFDHFVAFLVIALGAGLMSGIAVFSTGLVLAIYVYHIVA